MNRMKLGEFCDKYCQDILARHQKAEKLFMADDFPYDEIITDESDTPFKVVYSETRRIPIWDILQMERQEFAKVYPAPSDLETYDNYCNSVILLEGEEALSEIRNTIRRELESIKNFGKGEEVGLASNLDE